MKRTLERVFVGLLILSASLSEVDFAHSALENQRLVRRQTRLNSIETLYLSGRYEAALSAVKLHMFLQENEQLEVKTDEAQRIQLLLLASLMSAYVGRFNGAHEYFSRAEALVPSLSGRVKERVQDSLALVKYDLQDLQVRSYASQD